MKENLFLQIEVMNLLRFRLSVAQSQAEQDVISRRIEKEIYLLARYVNEYIAPKERAVANNVIQFPKR